MPGRLRRGEYGVAALKVLVDLSTLTGAKELMGKAVAAYGRIDVLVNNVGGTIWIKPFHLYTEEETTMELERSLYPTLWGCLAVLPIMMKQKAGSIVNLGSGTGTGGEPRWGGYAAAKEGIRGLSKVAALEWGRDNIRVNVICPFAESEGVKLWKQFAPNDYAKAVGRVPMKRIGDVRTDVGALVAAQNRADLTPCRSEQSNFGH